MGDIVVRHRYRHPPERVFDAWLDPKTAAKFAFATPDGQMIKAEIDARVGGRFNFTDRRPEMGDVAHVGEYEVIDRPRRIVFTFGVPQFDPGYTRVTLDFVGVDGGCEVTLTHEGVPPEWQESTPQGWVMILAGLEAVLG
ncbi:SRPBCC domain-containing protein [uncultured Phenylobacterium sp.]|uniref:SRPBCC family protein n=1 Tax=uncultured Phenylobacterium sp. TaxID=349273 RepID=UPI0025EE783B|nr:SRPBCC domain-containing protein [uncultured Phenylobacterium sp.]